MHAAVLEGPEKGPSRPKPSGWSATRKWLAGCAPRGRRPADLSSDGKSVLAVVQSRPPQLVIYSTGAGETQQLERGGIENYATAQWFRDGKSVLICGNEPGKRTRLYVQQIGGGAAQPVSPEGTREGWLTSDGKFVLARGIDGKYSVYPIAGGEPRPVPGLAQGGFDGGRKSMVRARNRGSAGICPWRVYCGGT